MALVIVNPSPRAKHKPKRTTPKPTARKAATEGAKPMAKRRTAAQKAATARMIAANRRHRNPSPRKASTRRRVVRHRNPSPVHTYRRRRNPSASGGGTGSLFKELMTKEGAMQIAAIAGMPTIQELIIGQVMPTATGYTRVAVKAGLGLAMAFVAHKFLSKRLGMTMGVIAAGTAAAELIHAYQSSNVMTAAAVATTSGYGKPRRPPVAMKGYGQPLEYVS